MSTPGFNPQIFNMSPITNRKSCSDTTDVVLPAPASRTSGSNTHGGGSPPAPSVSEDVLRLMAQLEDLNRQLAEERRQKKILAQGLEIQGEDLTNAQNRLADLHEVVSKQVGELERQKLVIAELRARGVEDRGGTVSTTSSASGNSARPGGEHCTRLGGERLGEDRYQEESEVGLECGRERFGCDAFSPDKRGGVTGGVASGLGTRISGESRNIQSLSAPLPREDFPPPPTTSSFPSSTSSGVVAPCWNADHPFVVRRDEDLFGEKQSTSPCSSPDLSPGKSHLPSRSCQLLAPGEESGALAHAAARRHIGLRELHLLDPQIEIRASLPNGADQVLSARALEYLDYLRYDCAVWKARYRRLNRLRRGQVEAENETPTLEEFLEFKRQRDVTVTEFVRRIVRRPGGGAGPQAGADWKGSGTKNRGGHGDQAQEESSGGRVDGSLSSWRWKS